MFQSSQLKLSRAREHIETLHGLMYQPSLEGRIEILARFLSETHWECRCRLADPLPAEWGPIAGDAIQNLRAALDNAAWDLAGSAAGKHTYFPILDEERKWDSARNSSLRGVPEPVIDRVRLLQPYRLGEDARRHALKILGELSDVDKHRTIHLPHPITRLAPKVIVKHRRDYPVPSYTARVLAAPWAPRNRVELEDGQMIASMDFRTPPDQSRLRVELSLVVDVGFGEPLATIEDLQRVHDQVEEVLADLAGAVGGSYG